MAHVFVWHEAPLVVVRGFMMTKDAVDEFLRWEKLKRGEKTLTRNKNELRQFIVFVRNKHVEFIILDEVLEWLELSQMAGYASNSVSGKGATLRKFFRYLEMKGHRVIKPELIPIIPLERDKPKLPTMEQLEGMEMAILENQHRFKRWRNLALYWLLRDSGVRVGEIVSLDLKDLVVAKRMGLVRSEKKRGGKIKERQFFWHSPQTIEYLDKWIEFREQWKDRIEDDALFVTRSGKRLLANGVYQAFQRACNKAGVPVVNPHSLRHLFATDLAKRGANNSMISSLMGHENLSSSYSYTRLYGTDLEETYREFKQKEIVDN